LTALAQLFHVPFEPGDSSLVFLILLLAGLRCNVEFVGGEANGDQVEDQLVEKLDALVDCGSLTYGLDGDVAGIGLEVSPVDAGFDPVIPVTEAVEEAAEGLVGDFVVGVVAFGEVDEWAGEDPESEGEEFDERQHACYSWVTIITGFFKPRRMLIDRRDLAPGTSARTQPGSERTPTSAAACSSSR
jgi:hypothetical protein